MGQVDPHLVEDAIRRCIISSVTNINMNQLEHDRRAAHGGQSTAPAPQSTVELTQSKRQPLPPLVEVEPPPPPLPAPVPVEQLIKRVTVGKSECEGNTYIAQTPTITSIPLGARVANPTRLMVKVVRGQHLGDDVQQPIVCIELDEPSQRVETSKGLNINPYWEEEFVL
jgi:hypothetical protein